LQIKAKKTLTSYPTPTRLRLLGEDYWQAWFDGSALPNPGKMSIGVVLQSPSGERIQISQLLGDGDNNEAEFSALLALLRKAQELGVKKLQIFGDSRIVIDSMQQSDAALCRFGQHPRLPELHQQAQTICAGLEELDWQWLPRHRNQQADALASAARVKSP